MVIIRATARILGFIVRILGDLGLLHAEQE